MCQWTILLGLSFAALPGPRPADVISYAGQASPELERSLDDLATTLSRMTGRSFRRTAEPSVHGITVRLASPGQGIFAKHSIEAYRILGQGPDLELEAPYPQGLVLAIYDLLDRLGARWPAPGEPFAFVPARPDIRIRSSRQVVEPRFRMREFFGTGGLGAQTPVDPKGELLNAWKDYQRRNRWGGSEHIRGHMGTNFALDHRAELERHSDWRALVGGVRSPWSPSLKLCASSTGAVAALVADRVAAMRALLAKDPHTFAVSVEPADGGGHCECERCRARGGASESVFSLANAVAAAVGQEFPGKWVSLYAYNEHAAVPSVPLEPNVFVMVCPYGFHRTALEPDELLDAWSKKVSRLGVYDYWSIPDWNRDLPGLSPLEMSRRLDSWHDRRIEAFMIESSYSIGAVGPALWLASRRFFGEPPAAAALDEWLTLMFGGGRTALRPLILEWAGGYLASRDALGRAYEALERGLAATATEPAARARVLVYVRYVEYLRLRFELDQLERDDARRKAKAEELLRWVLSIAPDLSVASFRLAKLLVRDEAALGLEDPAKVSVTPPDEADTIARLEAARHIYPARPAARLSFSGRFVPAAMNLKARRANRQILLSGHTALRLQARTATTVLVERTKDSPAPTRLKLLDENDHVLAQATLSNDHRRAVFPLSQGLRYQLRVVDPRTAFRLTIPSAVQASFTQLSSPLATPTLYFYVPPKTLRVVLELPRTSPQTLLDGDGTTLVDRAMGGIEVPVPAGQAGRIWSVRGYHSWEPIRAINVPQSFSLDPEDLLIPERAIH